MHVNSGEEHLGFEFAVVGSLPTAVEKQRMKAREEGRPLRATPQPFQCEVNFGSAKIDPS